MAFRKDVVISQKAFGTARATHCSPVNLISVYRVVVTRIGFNTEQLKATEKVPLINFTRREKPDASEIIANNETHRDRKKEKPSPS